MKDDIYIPKRESTQTKIELASDVIRAENERRKELNKKSEKLLKKGKPATIIPLIKHIWEHTARKQRFKGNPGPIKNMGTMVLSNKLLCGKLSALCRTLRDNDIPYPWLEDV